MAMMAMTTSNSMSVNAVCFRYVLSCFIAVLLRDRQCPWTDRETGIRETGQQPSGGRPSRRRRALPRHQTPADDDVLCRHGRVVEAAGEQRRYLLGDLLDGMG